MNLYSNLMLLLILNNVFIIVYIVLNIIYATRDNLLNHFYGIKCLSSSHLKTADFSYII